MMTVMTEMTREININELEKVNGGIDELLYKTAEATLRYVMRMAKTAGKTFEEFIAMHFAAEGIDKDPETRERLLYLWNTCEEVEALMH